MALSDTDLALYPEEYLVEEDEMSESGAQSFLIYYLKNVLNWFYRAVKWFITSNLELRHPAINNPQNKIVPDVLIFKGKTIPWQDRRQATSWNVETRGAPAVVFEISSSSTWQDDIQGALHQKPATYGRIGVKEYWAYDPNDPAVWRNVEGRRLMGWCYDDLGQPQEIEADERGWYWSVELDSWLSAADDRIRLYDAAGQLRLMGEEIAEIERQARQAAEAERQAAEVRAQAAQQAAEAAEAQARAAREAAETQAQKVAELERELRRLRGKSIE